MSVIKIETGIKGLNYKIYKSFYQCYSGKKVDYSYQVVSCTDKGEANIGTKSNLKSAMNLIDEDKSRRKNETLCFLEV